MHWSRHLATVVLAAATGTAAGGAAWAAEGHVDVGELIADGFTSFDSRLTLGGDVTAVWSPHRYLGLALETGVAAARLPYGQSDEPAKLGNSDNIVESFTLLPRLMFGPRFVPTPNISLGVSVGSTWLWSSAGSDLAFIPYPTASVALQIKFGPGARYGVRAAFSYMHLWFGHDRAVLAPTVAFTWSY
jgi:hypothetical protein